MFATPSLRDLAERTARAFRANLKGSDARLWPNNVAVSAKVIAGAVWEAFAFLDYISRQSIKHLAEGIWLERHAYDYGLARLPASLAAGTVVLTGTNGVAVPAGIELRRLDGVAYRVTLGGTVAAGAVTLPVEALAEGRAGNAVPGTAVVLAAPLSSIVSEGEVGATGIGGGADAESDASLRERLLFRLRNPPHGGSASDYVLWAREVAGVTRVYVDPVTATNERDTVGIWFLMDDTYGDGIPQGADVTLVRAHIEPLRPAGAILSIGAPVGLTVDIEIDNLTPDTAAIRDGVAAALADLFRREAHVSTTTAPFTLYRSQIIEAIATVTGERHHGLTEPAADVACSTGQIPVLGSITYT